MVPEKDKNIFFKGLNFFIYRINYTCRTIFFKIFKNKRLDLPAFLDSVKNLKYIIIKKDGPGVKKSFPKDYPFGEDLDLIVLKKDFKMFISKIFKFVEKNKHFKIKAVLEQEGMRIRFLFLGHLHYQLDVRHKTQGLNEDFIKESISKRVAFKNTYMPKKKYELIYRLNDFFKDQHKKHHLKYILENQGDLDLKLIPNKKLLNFIKEKIIKENESKNY